MFKKTLIASALLLAATGVAFANGGTYIEQTNYAAPPVTHPSHQWGDFYVGASVGGNFVHYDTTRTSQYNYILDAVITEPDNMNFTTPTNHNFSGWGFGGDLFVGYGIPLQRHYYLGVEIFGAINSNKATYSTSGDLGASGYADFFIGNVDYKLQWLNKMQDEIKLGYSYGVSFIPGINVSDSTMLYGRVSWVRSRFEANLNNQFEIKTTYSNIPLTINLPLSANFKKNDDGIQLGLGVEIMIANNCSIRAEYDWSRYNSFSISKNDSVTTITPGGGNPDIKQTLTIVSTVKVKKPVINQLKLAVVYHFTV